MVTKIKFNCIFVRCLYATNILCNHIKIRFGIDRGGFFYLVMFEVLSNCVQAMKRLVTLLAVCREGYARKNPHISFKVCSEVLMNYLLHPANVVQGRFAKNVVLGLPNCTFLFII